jgi:hypothetical protein
VDHPIAWANVAQDPRSCIEVIIDETQDCRGLPISLSGDLLGRFCVGGYVGSVRLEIVAESVSAPP